MVVYTPISYCAELQLAFKGKITREVADTLQKLPVNNQVNNNL